MNRGETPSEGIEFLDADPSDDDVEDVLSTPAPRRPVWLALGVAAVAIAAASALIARVHDGPGAAPLAHASATADPSPAASSFSAATPPITVVKLGAPLLGARAGWEVFGRGAGVVVRIDLTRDLVTRTAVPALSSNGPVSFVVGTRWALIRPIDFVPGYLVPDRRSVGPAPGVLGAGGPAFPGPDPDHVWVPAGDDAPDRMVLVDVHGRATGPTLDVPAGSSALSAVPDQTGYLLFAGSRGAYDVRPGHTSHVTSGTVLAVGPTRWLISACDPSTRCTTEVVDRTSGARRALHLPSEAGIGPPGVISPGGGKAALIVRAPQAAIEIVDLTTGTGHTLPLGIDLSTADEQSMAWSPDGRWLLAVVSDGKLYAVDTATGRITDVTDTTRRAVPDLSQIAVREAAAD